MTAPVSSVSPDTHKPFSCIMQTMAPSTGPSASETEKVALDEPAGRVYGADTVSEWGTSVRISIVGSPNQWKRSHSVSALFVG